MQEILATRTSFFLSTSTFHTTNYWHRWPAESATLPLTLWLPRDGKFTLPAEAEWPKGQAQGKTENILSEALNPLDA